MGVNSRCSSCAQQERWDPQPDQSWPTWIQSSSVCDRQRNAFPARDSSLECSSNVSFHGLLPTDHSMVCALPSRGDGTREWQFPAKLSLPRQILLYVFESKLVLIFACFITTMTGTLAATTRSSSYCLRQWVDEGQDGPLYEVEGRQM